ncbi:MAG: glutamine--tRNA ligase, partial [Candidatus Neomarinimicrobiota bacterium]|nr:glutamine--tRNA ligase [Candidatus Neomarinimicrobiota bacterium]
FTSISPDSETDYLDSINTDSLEILTNCLIEPDLQHLSTDIPVQFERIGYFFKDSDSNRNSLIFNRTVALRDNWSK